MLVCAKRSFSDYHAAGREASVAKRKLKSDGVAAKIKPYLCVKCGQFHIGRGPKGIDKPKTHVDADGTVSISFRRRNTDK